jgi:hypothetical protein
MEEFGRLNSDTFSSQRKDVHSRRSISLRRRPAATARRKMT